MIRFVVVTILSGSWSGKKRKVGSNSLLLKELGSIKRSNNEMKIIYPLLKGEWSSNASKETNQKLEKQTNKQRRKCLNINLRAYHRYMC